MIGNPFMYVCNCNGLNERDVDAAIRAGASRNGEVHAFHGCRPECAKCLPDIRERLLRTMTGVEIAAATPAFDGFGPICQPAFAPSK